MAKFFDCLLSAAAFSELFASGSLLVFNGTNPTMTMHDHVHPMPKLQKF
jgi:hypothetical protein